MNYTRFFSKKCRTESASKDFPGDPVVRNPPANSGDKGWTPGLGRFLQGN